MSNNFDIQNVGLIKLPNQKVYDFVKRKVYEITHTLSNNNNDSVHLLAKQKELGVVSNRQIRDLEFKEILEDVIGEIKNGDEEARLENHLHFSTLIDKQYMEVISVLNEKYTNSYFIKSGERNLKKEGLGFIVNSSTKEEMATFESLSFNYDSPNSLHAGKHKIELQLQHVISAVDLLSDFVGLPLAVVYYDIGNNEILNFDVSSSVKDFIIDNDNGIASISLVSSKVRREEFDESHLRHQFISERNSEKENIDGLDIKDPVNAIIYNNFFDKRLNIVKSFKENLRKDEIFQEFADIDI